MLQFRIMTADAKVYTKYGDTGQTSLLYGGRVSKNSPHTEAYGMTDEAVSAMGLARALSEDPEVKTILKELQREMFTVGAELATAPDQYETYQKHFNPCHCRDGDAIGRAYRPDVSRGAGCLVCSFCPEHPGLRRPWIWPAA